MPLREGLEAGVGLSAGGVMAPGVTATSVYTIVGPTLFETAHQEACTASVL